MGWKEKLNIEGRRISSGVQRVCTLMSLLFLAACAAKLPPPPPGEQVPVEDRTVQEKVREPAQQERGGVQVFPLQNPAVKELMAKADVAETSGDYDAAVVSIERALRIQPRDPELLQKMAELQLQKKDYQQALNFASRSYDAGPRVGELCNRNWRTMSVAQEALGDSRSASLSQSRARDCNNQRPQSY
jgi:tetratricopeptide (TPR) repeat protein